MIAPHFLKTKSKIAILSPSGYINPDFVKSLSEYISAQGFEPVIYPSCFNKHFQFGGTDEERLTDLQNALNNQSIEAIFCSRGGYGAIRILDKLDFKEFEKNPKWIIGFSDITNFHLAVNRLGVMSIHSQMAKDVHLSPDADCVTGIFKILKGEFPGYTVESNILNRTGIAEAEVVGGNMSIINSLLATKFQINTEGKILFIEDLNEYLYHVDRMMISLKMSGKLDNLKGLIVGAYTDMKDNANPFGKTAHEIISEHVAEYNFPVCYDFPVGHIENNLPIVSGLKYTLTVNSEETRFYPAT